MKTGNPGPGARHASSRLWLCAGLAALIHMALFITLIVRQTTEEPEAQLAGRFVKRRPLRQRVLERRVRQPQRQRRLQRTVSVPRASMHRAVVPPAAPQPAAVLVSQRLLPSLPLRAVRTGLGLSGAHALDSGGVGVAVASESALDLDLELLDVGAMDTGQHRALVVVDPEDRRGLEGYVHLSALRIEAALELAEGRRSGDLSSLSEYRVQHGWAWATDWRHQADVRALVGLGAELEAHSGLSVVVDQDASLGDPRWLDSPMVLLTSLVEFTPTRQEVANLGRYLVSGGLAYVEVVGDHSSAASVPREIRDLTSLRSLIRQALASQGLQERVDWSFEPLPMSHPLFSCYYDIETLPANYWRSIHRWTHSGESSSSRTLPLYDIPDYLEGVHLDGRLAVIYSQQNYRDFWARRPDRALAEPSESGVVGWVLRHCPPSDPAIRVGINVVVYALTQEGSLARRYVRCD